MSTYPDHILRVGSQHLAELKRKTAEFERELWDAHESLEQEIEQTAFRPEVAADACVPEAPVDGLQESFRWTADDGVAARGADGRSQLDKARAPSDLDAGSQAQLDKARAPSDLDADSQGQLDKARAPSHLDADGPGRLDVAQAPIDLDGPARRFKSPEDRTARLIDHGRRRAAPTHRGRKVVLIGLAVAIVAALLTVLVLDLSRPGPAWPASVATVERQIAVACRNPDVRSEPSQVNFACGKSTREVLWVFSLMTSGNNPDFASIRTGRQGLEPIRPSVGGQVAWSLNLHHPYSPANPIDSLQVAARAINNIIGGATMTAANGKPIVQPGLESVPANCARYTGSGAVTSRDGFPALCAKPITSEAGQGYLVADVFRKWVVGARPGAAQDAAVLFQNAHDPGDPQVRAILRSLTRSRPSG
jgi:hypothetical protein